MANRWFRPPPRILGPDGEEKGYWARWWAEFKRLLVKMAWEDKSAVATMVFGLVLIVVAFVGGWLFGW